MWDSLPEEVLVKFSTKGRYALRLMLDLAQHPGRACSLREVSERQGISGKYLEQIIPLLRGGGLLVASRGSEGGYRLARSPDRICAGEILRLTEGDLLPIPCLACDPPDCPRRDDCLTLPLWRGLADVIANYLDNTTLQDLLDAARDPDAGDYVI